MKIYVAAKFSDKESVKSVYNFLRSAGHTITHDWTNNLPATPFSLNPDFTAKCASEDIDGVIKADVFILLSNNEPSMGASAELGAAIATNILFKKIKIYIVGPHFDKNFCFFHPAVKQIESVEDILKDL